MDTNTITEDYVPFKTAQLLKGKRFNVPVRTFYNPKYKGQKISHGTALINYNADPKDGSALCSAPTVQMANQFLRVKYHLHISIGFNSNGYMWHIINCEYDNCYSHGLKGGFKTAKDANNDALNVCLNTLIK